MKKNKPVYFCSIWFFLFILVLSTDGFTQKIAINEMDQDKNQQRIELAPLKIVSTSKTKMNFSIGTVGSSAFIRLSGSGTGANIVNIGDKLVLHLENDSTLTLQSPKLQTYDVEEITSTYDHTYNLSMDALARLSKNNLRRLRKYHTDGYDDIAISNQNGRQVKNFSAFFIEELKKNNLFRPDSALVAKEDNPYPVDTMTAPQVVQNRAAAFPGGENVWMDFLNKNLKAPAELKSNETKSVMVQFRVKENGSINELEIVKSAGPAFDKEVLRVLKRMPYWKPAVENGLPVSSMVIKSITISREDASVGL